MPVPFVLLVLSICAAWLPALSVSKELRVPPWAVVYAVAVVAAFAQGFLQVSAVVALIALVALALCVTRATRKVTYWLAFALLLLLCLTLALHKMPGFNNPIVIDGVQFSPDARPFTQYPNFDKGSVGLVLLALLSPKLRRGDHAGRLAAETAAGYALTTVVVIGAVREQRDRPALERALGAERAFDLLLHVRIVRAVVAAAAPRGGIERDALHVARQACGATAVQDRATGRGIAGAREHEDAVTDRRHGLVRRKEGRCAVDGL